MPIAVRGSATNYIDFGGAAFNVDKPTGVVENDVMIAVVHSQYYAYSDLTGPSGWTLLDGRDSGGMGGHSKVFYKVAGASEGASYSFSASGNGAHVSASIIAFSGVPLTGGVPTFVVAKDTNANDDAPSVTPTGSADMLVCIALADHDGGTGRTYTTPASMTERMDSGWGYLSHVIATELLASSAATGTRDFVGAGNTPNAGSQAQYSIAISSGAGGGSTPVVGADTASAADAKSALAAALSRADTGSGADAGALAAALTRADTATGTDAATLAAAAAASDTATGADAATSAASATGGETGSGADSAALVVAITASDTAAAVDAVADLDTGATAKTGSDTAAAAEAGTTAATTTAADTAAATDTAAVAAARTVADTATATESATVTVILASSDTATAADLAALAASVAAAELAATLEAASWTDPGVVIAPTPAERTVVTPAESRTVITPAESRTVVTPAEHRQEA